MDGYIEPKPSTRFCSSKKLRTLSCKGGRAEGGRAEGGGRAVGRGRIAPSFTGHNSSRRSIGTASHGVGCLASGEDDISSLTQLDPLRSI